MLQQQLVLPWQNVSCKDLLQPRVNKGNDKIYLIYLQDFQSACECDEICVMIFNDGFYKQII